MENTAKTIEEVKAEVRTAFAAAIAAVNEKKVDKNYPYEQYLVAFESADTEFTTGYVYAKADLGKVVTTHGISDASLFTHSHANHYAGSMKVSNGRGPMKAKVFQLEEWKKLKLAEIENLIDSMLSH